MMRVKVYPPTDYLSSFLQAKGFLLVSEKPQILHYTGTKDKELLDLLRDDKPDLLILHSFLPKKILESQEVFWVWHPLRGEKDLYRVKKLVTNAFRPCQMYYQRIGMQADIQTVRPRPSKKSEKGENIFASRAKLKEMFSRFCEWMVWD